MAAKQVGVCAVAACVGLAASVALADPSSGSSVANPYGHIDAASGELYVGGAVGAQWMTLPEWESGGETPGPAPVEAAEEIDADGWLYGGQVWVGVGIDAGPGENTRIQLEGSYAEGDLDGSQFRPSPGGDDRRVLLDGSAGNVGIVDDSFTTLDVDVRGWEAGVRALTDALTDTRGALTPSLMIFGGEASQDYDAHMIDAINRATILDHFARQDVDVWYVGVEAAIAATVNLSPAATLSLGGRVAGLYFDANMDGEDCIDFQFSPPGTDGCNADQTSSVSDGMDTLTYRGGGFVGVNYDIGGATVGIMGTADVVPMAEIVNPRFEGDSPSHLGVSHELIYGVRGSIVIPLTGSAAKDLSEAGKDLREAGKDLREAFVAKGRSVWAALMSGRDEPSR